jgi:DNA-binding MarR family transcriptional regulator
VQTGFIWSIDLLSHLVRQQINALLAPLGLTFPKYSALKAIEDKQALTNADLARSCLVRPQTMNSVVRDLQAAGLISAAAAPDHNLKILYSLTPQAKELLAQAHAIVQGLENAFLVGLGEAKVQEMQEMMQNTLARLQRADASQ